MSTRDNHVVHAYPNVHHRLPDPTEKHPQLTDSPFRLGPHNWLQRIYAQTGILSLSGGYKEDEEGRGHELCESNESRAGTETSTRQFGLCHPLVGRNPTIAYFDRVPCLLRTATNMKSMRFCQTYRSRWCFIVDCVVEQREGRRGGEWLSMNICTRHSLRQVFHIRIMDLTSTHV